MRCLTIVGLLLFYGCLAVDRDSKRSATDDSTPLVKNSMVSDGFNLPDLPEFIYLVTELEQGRRRDKVTKKYIMNNNYPQKNKGSNASATSKKR